MTTDLMRIHVILVRYLGVLGKMVRGCQSILLPNLYQGLVGRIDYSYADAG